MRFFGGVLLLLLSLWNAGIASATNLKLSAGVREYFLNADDYNFGSDYMARLKHALEKDGFDSFTFSFRLGLKNTSDSYVTAPLMRTELDELRVIIRRVLVSNEEITFKPLISKLPGLGVADRLTQLNPENLDLFFATYKTQLTLYFKLAQQEGVSEIVLGVGMGKLWNERCSKHWLELSQYAEKTVGDRTRLSIEITSENDISALESWKSHDQKTFEEFSRRLSRIRIAGTQVEKIPNRLTRVDQLFPGKKWTLSNITIPACGNVQWNEDEASCNEQPHLGTTEIHDLQLKQSEALASWLKLFDGLPTGLKSRVAEIELRAATTNFDPPTEKLDFRPIHYNLLAQEVLSKWKTSTTNTPPAPSSPQTPDFSSLLDTSKKQACVFYDQANPKDLTGSIHAPMLQSLLGAFPEWRSIRENISDFNKSHLAKCDSVFYIASNFSLEPPAGFYDGLVEFSQKHPVVWMNYKVSEFAKVYNNWAEKTQNLPLGFDVAKIDQPLAPPTAITPDPGYFRFFDYKGEVFEKHPRWNYLSNILATSPELNLITISDSTHVHSLSTARHSKLDSVTPYGVQRPTDGGGSIWYFNDLPLGFVESGTPYFIFCDVLWDILQATPPSGPRSALVRIEDINPSQNQADLRWVIDYLADQGVPFSLAVIPYYSNLFDDPIESEGKFTWKPVDQYDDFVGTLQYAKRRGANFVFHGVEHMGGDLVSGFTGVTGDDYEFWLYPQNTPHPQDSSDFVINKLERGEAVFKRLGIIPRVWESPHYAASALDYTLFGKLFQWVYHRSINFDAQLDQDVTLATKYRIFEALSLPQRESRRDLLRQVRMSGNFSTFGGQIIPYPVYRDVYGQAVIPETLDYIDFAFYEDDPKRTVKTPADLLREAQRLKVIRGAFASFFWHVDLLSPKQTYYRLHPGSYEKEGGKKTLITMIEGLRNLGYQFKSIADRSLFPDH